MAAVLGREALPYAPYEQSLTRTSILQSADNQCIRRITSKDIIVMPLDQNSRDFRESCWSFLVYASHFGQRLSSIFAGMSM